MKRVNQPRAYMLAGVPIKEFRTLAGFFPRLSLTIIDFITMFFRRIGTYLGLDFFVPVPGTLDPTLLNGYSYQKLEFLRKEGIISNYFLRKKEFDDEPYFFSAFININGRQRMGYSGYGRSLSSPQKAWGPAIGEALERWSLEHYAPTAKDIKVLSVEELKLQSDIDLFTIAGISQTKRSIAKSKRRLQLDLDARFSCIRVEELCSGGRVLAPLQWFSFSHAAKSTDEGTESVLLPLTTTGAAAGQSIESAQLRGMFEIIERDAFMIHWMGGIVPDRIDLEKDHSQTATCIKNIARRYNLEVYFLYLRTDFPTHVIMAVIIDRTGVGPAVNVDATAGDDLEVCMERSFLGALGLRPYIRRSLRDDQKYRTYLSHAVPELTLESRGFWWSTVERIPLFEPFLKGMSISADEIPSFPKITEKEKRTQLLNYCKEMQYPVFSQTVSSDRASEAINTWAVMVKMPNLQPMHFNEWEICDYGGRLTEMPSRLKLKKSIDMQSVPHPFAQ